MMHDAVQISIDSLSSTTTLPDPGGASELRCPPPSQASSSAAWLTKYDAITRGTNHNEADREVAAETRSAKCGGWVLMLGRTSWKHIPLSSAPPSSPSIMSLAPARLTTRIQDRYRFRAIAATRSPPPVRRHCRALEDGAYPTAGWRRQSDALLGDRYVSSVPSRWADHGPIPRYSRHRLPSHRRRHCWRHPDPSSMLVTPASPRNTPSVLTVAESRCGHDDAAYRLFFIEDVHRRARSTPVRRPPQPPDKDGLHLNVGFGGPEGWSASTLYPSCSSTLSHNVSIFVVDVIIFAVGCSGRQVALVAEHPGTLLGRWRPYS
ncbi:hypothetical protein C8Q77DRAFT_170542 [Trametes polyzona]|nr:hypothetical protein C8Q77DRAFT_170542 [Trametes polyzona]